MHKHLLILFLSISFISANAQSEGATADSVSLIHKDSLVKFLPESVGNYQFDQISIPPSFSSPPKSTIVNALYVAEDDKSFFIQLAHYLLPKFRDEMSHASWKSSLLDKAAVRTSYKTHTAYEKKSPAKVSVYINDDFEVAAYSARGDGSVDDLYEALNALDFASIEQMINRHIAANKGQAEAEAEAAKVLAQNDTLHETNAPMAEVHFGEIDCDTFNIDFKEKMTKEMGAKFAPWIHFLQGEQASTAEINGNEMVFPKKGNDWLQCVKMNDILWSPYDMPMFIKRVKEITDKSDRIIFKTENSGLDEVILQGRVEIGTKGGEKKK